MFVDYPPGDVPFVGNGFSNNGVTGFVIPREEDKVFHFNAISVSAFCEATVQTPPFVACGRAGNGIVVLQPKTPMQVRQLAYIASYINLAVRWRFNWYRQTTAERLRKLTVPHTVAPGIAFSVMAALPIASPVSLSNWRMHLRPFVLGDLYEIQSGDFHNLSDLEPGSVPVVSCGHADNGVSGYYDVKEPVYRNRMTIAFNGNTLTAKFHPYEFATKDDVAICNPKRNLRITTELFIQMMINRERWRYSYYRKCFADKLRRFEVSLPARGGELDEDTMEAVVKTAPYWAFVQSLIRPLRSA